MASPTAAVPCQTLAVTSLGRKPRPWKDVKLRMSACGHQGRRSGEECAP